MKNPFRVYFWMLGQDARLGLLREWGFERQEGSVYRRGPLMLHQLGLTLEDDLLYERSSGRFFQVSPGWLPPEPPKGVRALAFHSSMERLLPHWIPYEAWVEQRMGPDYRRRLLRLCPPLLRPLRQHWKRAFRTL